MIARRSSRGDLYYVAEPLVPRILDAYLDCAIYLYGSEVDAEDGGRTGGSGFLVGVPTKGLRQNFWFIYAISNKHVIDNSRFIRLNTIDGKTSIMSSSRHSWIDHPDGDDISACVISFDPKAYKFNNVPRSRFLSKDIVKEFNIGPGDDLFVVGRFINHEGRQRNLPTVRFGNISQMPWEPIKQDNGFDQESFLTEIRSIGGYSGSPVFVSIPILSAREIKDWAPPDDLFKMDKFPYGALQSHGPWLLGVDWGHLNNWEPVCGESQRPVNPNPKAMQVKLNTGIACVVPAWKLADLLDAGPLADHRAKIEREVLEYVARNPSVASMDGLEG